jgi:ParB family chromosome partitioning protein
MQLIDISTIKTTNQYLRLDTNVEMLKKSIETVGLINPIVLNLNNELIAGGRRYTAMKELGFTEVPTVTVDKSDLEQELISIDENLVRKDLTNIELEASLARGRELYETLYPDATKFSDEDLTLPESNEVHSDMANDKRSFIDMTAEKTGLSKKVIKSAIDRDEKASGKVKELRSHGELNASQTNEIIKLSKEEQEHVADLVKDKSAKEVKELVKNVSQNGLQSAVNELVNSPLLPKEYKSLKTLLQRTNKTLGKILIEEMTSEHEEVNAILDQMSTLRLSLDQFLVLCTGNNKADDTNYEEVVDEAMTAMNSDHSETTMESDSAGI